jgi:hypothetical protein
MMALRVRQHFRRIFSSFPWALRVEFARKSVESSWKFHGELVEVSWKVHGSVHGELVEMCVESTGLGTGFELGA